MLQPEVLFFSLAEVLAPQSNLLLTLLWEILDLSLCEARVLAHGLSQETVSPLLTKERSLLSCKLLVLLSLKLNLTSWVDSFLSPLDAFLVSVHREPLRGRGLELSPNKWGWGSGGSADGSENLNWDLIPLDGLGEVALGIQGDALLELLEVVGSPGLRFGAVAHAALVGEHLGQAHLVVDQRLHACLHLLVELIHSLLDVGGLSCNLDALFHLCLSLHGAELGNQLIKIWRWWRSSKWWSSRWRRPLSPELWRRSWRRRWGSMGASDLWEVVRDVQLCLARVLDPLSGSTDADLLLLGGGRGWSTSLATHDFLRSS